MIGPSTVACLIGSGLQADARHVRQIGKFKPVALRQIHTAGDSQNPDTKSQNVKSPELGTPIAHSGAMTAAAAAIPSPYSVSRSADFSAPTAVRDTSAAVSYTSPDLAPAAHPVSYVTPPQGQVLGASTENASPQNFATVQQLADLQNQIDALKNLPRSIFVPSFSGPAASTPVSTATFALSQKIDQLSGTSLSNITVNGVSGLTDADIPDGITASNYLPLSGGTLSGLTNFSNASTSLLSVFSTGYFGGTATSTFTSAGWLGIGTSSPGSALSVSGNAYLSGFYNTSGVTGGYQIDGHSILQASSTLFSLFVGQDAGNTSTAGTANTAIGYQAGSSLTVPASGANPQANVFIGYQAGKTVTTARETIAIGYQALPVFQGNGAGVDDGINTVIGSQAGQNLLTGQSNVFLGQKAGENTTSGSDNVYIGTHTATGMGVGSYNTFVGMAVADSGTVNISGSNNTAIGNGSFGGAGEKKQRLRRRICWRESNCS